MPTTHNKSAFLVALLGGSAYGFAQNIITGIITEKPWSEQNDVIRASIATSILFGAAIGCLFGGFISDFFGPKRALLISSIDVVLCAVILIIQSHSLVLVLFRGISGLGIGCISSIAPLYISEQSTEKVRGKLVSFYQLSICGGLVIAYIFNFFFGKIENGWRFFFFFLLICYRYEFGFTALFPLLILISFRIPESEIWEQQKKKGGRKSISTQSSVELDKSGKIIISEDNEKLLNEDIESENNNNGDVYKIKKKASVFWNMIKIHKASFIACCILACNVQLTGINAILSYFPTIVENLGVTSVEGQLGATVGLGAWNMISTFISIFLVYFFFLFVFGTVKF
jgi:MFS family permease